MEGESRNFYDALRNRLLLDERIVGVSGSSDDLPYFGWSTTAAEWEGKDPDENVLINFNIIDYDFIETFGMELQEGRDFSREFTTDMNRALLLNEEAVKQFGFDSGLDKRLTPGGQNDLPVVGCLKDYYFKSNLGF